MPKTKKQKRFDNLTPIQVFNLKIKDTDMLIDLLTKQKIKLVNKRDAL